MRKPIEKSKKNKEKINTVGRPSSEQLELKRKIIILLIARSLEMCLSIMMRFVVKLLEMVARKRAKLRSRKKSKKKRKRKINKEQR